MDRDTRLDLADGSDRPGAEVYDQDADGPPVDGYPASEDPYAEDPYAALPPPPRSRPARPRGRRPTVRRPAPGRPAVGPSAVRRSAMRSAAGLATLVALALASAFFAWVSVEPFWLAVGRGTTGTVIVTGCDGAGVTTRCAGSFVSGADGWTVPGVDLSGVPDGSRLAGAEVAARMLDEDARSAYAGPVWGLHLRWGLGLLLVLACGAGIAAGAGTGTGAGAGTATARRRTVQRLLGLVGPLLVLAGLLASALV